MIKLSTIMDMEAETMVQNSTPWAMTPFNALYLAVFACFILLLVVASLLLRGRSERAKVTVLAAACAVTLLSFIYYKYALSVDREYALITAGMGGFNWWG